jgi:hypothetical protein
LPQLLLSVKKLVHCPAQQYGAVPGQTFPQAPQLLESLKV